jgi:hypothetical protein
MARNPRAARFDSRWDDNVSALLAWADKNGTPMAPAGAVIKVRDSRGSREVNVGSFVAYVRSRYRKGLLDQSRKKQIDSIPGWTWARLQPGPKGEVDRNEEIRKLRRQGVTLGELAEQFGMSRQRIHQIAPDVPNESKHKAHLRKRREERAVERVEEMRAAEQRARRTGR